MEFFWREPPLPLAGDLDFTRHEQHDPVGQLCALAHALNIGRIKVRRWRDGATRFARWQGTPTAPRFRPMTDGALTGASARLRRPSGRPRRITAASIGSDIQWAPSEAASSAAMSADFAAALPPRGLTLKAAAAYSGLSIRAFWRLISDGTLRPIRAPHARRLLIDRLDLDELLTAWKQTPSMTSRIDQVGEPGRGRS